MQSDQFNVSKSDNSQSHSLGNPFLLLVLVKSPRNFIQRTLTLWERVGLHDMQKNVHHMEQDPYGSRFVMGQSLVNSRRHITEIQLSRGWESPRLRLLLEFAGRQKHPQQQEDPGLPHRAEIKPRLVFKLGLNTQRGL